MEISDVETSKKAGNSHGRQRKLLIVGSLSFMGKPKIRSYKCMKKTWLSPNGQMEGRFALRVLTNLESRWSGCWGGCTGTHLGGRAEKTGYDIRGREELKMAPGFAPNLWGNCFWEQLGDWRRSRSSMEWGAIPLLVMLTVRCQLNKVMALWRWWLLVGG